MIAGAVAGAAQSIVCGPVELAKTRLQLQTGDAAASAGPNRPTGPLQCLIQVPS